MKYLLAGFFIAMIAFWLGVSFGHSKMFKQCQIELRKERESSFLNGVVCGAMALKECQSSLQTGGRQFDGNTITNHANELGKQYYYIGR